EALRLQHRKRLQLRPLFRLVQTLQLIEHITTAGFQPSMILFNSLDKVVRCLTGGMGVKVLQEVPYRLGQLGLVVFDCQKVVSSAGSYSLRNVGLGPYGIDGYGATAQRQSGQQFRN